MNLPTLLFLTNFSNGAPKEDIALSNELRTIAQVLIAHPLDCLKKFPPVDGVIIRNIWPTHENTVFYEQFYKTLLRSNIKTYNPIIGKGDVKGKNYLVELYRKGYPVIPSVDSVSDVKKLPRSEWYFSKPKHSCDGIGSAILSKVELQKRKIKDNLIQPYITFESEPSFFFIDNEFAYAVITKNRIQHERCKTYLPSVKEIAFAKQFVTWNNLPYGIQRIDTLKLRSGELLLSEIEDICPYLYLLEIDEKIKRKILRRILTSLESNLM